MAILCLALAACNSSSSSSSNNGDKSNDNGSDNTNDNGNGGNGNGGNGGSGSSVAKRFITLEELGKGNLFYAINLSVDASADDSNPQITKVAEGDEQVAAFEEHSQDIQLVVTKATTAPDFTNDVPAITIMSFSLEASTDLLVFQAADEEGIESTAQSSGDALRIHFLKPETAYTIWYRIGSRVVRGAGFSTTAASDTTTGTSGSITHTWDNGLAQLATQSIRFSVRIGEPVPDLPGYIDYTPDVDIGYIDGYYYNDTTSKTAWSNNNKTLTIGLALTSDGFSLHEFSHELFPDASTDIPIHVYHYNPVEDSSANLKSPNTVWANSLFGVSIYFVGNSPIELQRKYSFHYIP